jgi:hypothetical protein
VTDDDHLQDWLYRQRIKWPTRALLLVSPLLVGLLCFGFYAAVTGSWPKAGHFTTHDRD